MVCCPLELSLRHSPAGTVRRLALTGSQRGTPATATTVYRLVLTGSHYGRCRAPSCCTDPAYGADDAKEAKKPHSLTWLITSTLMTIHPSPGTTAIPNLFFLLLEIYETIIPKYSYRFIIHWFGFDPQRGQTTHSPTQLFVLPVVGR